MSFLLTPRRAFALALVAVYPLPAQQFTQNQLNTLFERNGYIPADGVKEKSAPEATEDKKASAAGAANAAAASLEEKLTGAGLGAGIAVLYTSGGRPVESAQIDAGNVVRIETKSKMRAGAILEFHWLFEELPFANPTEQTKGGQSAISHNKGLLGDTVLQLRKTKNYDDQGVRRAGVTVPEALRRHVSWGPMFTAEIGDNTLRSVGAGLMLAFQHYSVNGDGAVERRSMPFNVGLIGFAEPNVKHVKGGFTDGQVVPAGTTLHLEEEHRFGFGVVFSSRF